MNAPLYTTEILRLAASLQEPRQLSHEDGRAELRSPTCGSRVAVAVELDEAGRVKCVSQQVHACAFGQASAALMERSAVGRGHDDAVRAMIALSAWLAGERDDTGDWPGLVALEPARSRTSRHGAILLPFRALVAALEANR
ncbi:MAG: iron-sulfur cluster assembly scaffold protein [Sphingomicrobium sp.]